MNTSILSNTCKSIGKQMKKKSPTIAVGIGLVCFGCALYTGIKETPKAIKLIEAKKEEMGLEKEENLGPIETVKTVWKCYIPTGITFVAGVTCILGAHHAFSTRNAALAAAYSLSESAFKEYKSKVIETIGEKHEKKVRDEIAAEKVKENPPENTQIFVTGRGKTRCYDCQTGRYFESDIETIRKIVNKLNYELTSEHYISMNEFFYEIGLPHTDIGDILGWNVEDGLIDINFTSMLPDDGIPTLVLNYMIAPRYEYWK